MSLADIDTDELEVGVRVEARYRGRSEFYAGKIAKVNLDGTFNINYDDGESENSVKRGLIRIKGGSPTKLKSPTRFSNTNDLDLQEGTAVEADYKGKGKYYAGKIARVRLNGTFDIDYDDGEKEPGVPRSAIRAKAT